MSAAFGDIKTEAGLKKLEDHLATRSYLNDQPQATREDFDVCAQIAPADGKKFPHIVRWQKQLKQLKTAFPLRKWAASGPAAASGGGGGRGGGEGGKGKDQANLEGLLKGAIEGKVCTRFPPEPSGYLHIGHCKAVMLNNHYARHFKGKLIVRFDDTNPSKEKMEFEESIISDLGTLHIKPDQVSHTSDYFDDLQKLMEHVIKKGMAYVDDTDVETMRKERDIGTESKRRGLSVEENLRLWKEMLAGSEEGKKCCVRGKLDMQSKNKCLRDPVFYRCKTDVAHHQHGFKYKAYPTYDFACPCVDSIEGVSHALRTIEYKDRDEMYQWVQKATDSRKVDLVEFSKTQFSHTVLSKRKLAWFVDNNKVEGWNDPRFPTVQGVLRRGMTVEALQDFVLTQGMSKATNLMEWDKIWAINKQKIDPIIPRYAAVLENGAVPFDLKGIDGVVCTIEKKHAKNDELGERLLMRNKDVWIEQEDAQWITEGEEITLMHWGNVFVDKIEKNSSGSVVKMSGRVHPEGNPKTTKKKVHWVANLPDQVTPVLLREFDHLVSKEKIEDDDNIEDIVNPCSVFDTTAIGDPMLKTLQKGDKLQLERRGYYIVDSINIPPGNKPMVMLKIPDGKAKDMGMKSQVDPSKLQGARGEKGDKKEAAAAKKEEPKAAEAKKEAKPKGEAKAEKGDAKAKAKAKAAAKPADRPIEDVTRLNILVGQIKKVWPHESAEKLYCEEIDVGEKAVRTIASGLRAHLKEEDMLGKLVCVLANLKPRKMQGFESQGMVMCATTAEGKVVLLQPPAGAKVGERVTIEGVEMLDADDKLNEKTGKAPWPVVQPGLLTDDKAQATYKGALWQTSAGPVIGHGGANGTIS